MPPERIVMLLGVLLGLQPVATDLYLPALPALSAALGAPVAVAQLTLSVLIIAFGLAQLIVGPLADRHGRRPVLLAGTALFVVAGLASAAAPDIGWMIAGRALQGVGLAAAVACARSIVRDLYAPAEGARVMSRALTVLGVLALSSPLAGGLIATHVHWRAAIVLQAVLGLGVLALIGYRYVETVPRRQPDATRLSPLLRNWRAVIEHPTFRAWTLLLCASYGGLFAMLASSSFVFINVLGASRATYGLLMGSFSLAYIGGTLLCRRLLPRIGLRRAVRIGSAASLAGGLSMAALSLADAHLHGWGVWSLVLPQWLYAIGHGINQPCAQAGAVGPFPDKAGTAASLSGFLMMVVAFAVGLAVGHLPATTVFPMSLGVGVGGLAVAAIGWTLVQRHGEPSRVRAEPVTGATA